MVDTVASSRQTPSSLAVRRMRRADAVIALTFPLCALLHDLHPLSPVTHSEMLEAQLVSPG